MPRHQNPADVHFYQGKPVAYGKLFFFDSNTSNPKDTFADSAETVKNPHPVILEADGREPNIFFTGQAKEILQTDNGTQVYERDPVGGEFISGNFSDYNDQIAYNENDIVKGSDGNFYRSISNGNVGNDPVSSPSNWVRIQFIEDWNSSAQYSSGDVVIESNKFWTSQTNNANTLPSSDSGTNWLPTLEVDQSVAPKLSSGDIEAGGVINQIRDSGAFGMPLANSVAANAIAVVELPDVFSDQTPTLTASGSDVFRSIGGTDTVIAWVGAARLTFTSNGVDEWSL